MEECWRNLPYELYARVVAHLDAATRRDLWKGDKRLPGPQRLVEPSLDLKFENVFLYPYPLEFLATYTSWYNDNQDIMVELTWGVNTFTYKKTKRIKFMTVGGFVIWRDVEGIMLMYHQTDDQTYEQCKYNVPI